MKQQKEPKYERQRDINDILEFSIPLQNISWSKIWIWRETHQPA